MSRSEGEKAARKAKDVREAEDFKAYRASHLDEERTCKTCKTKKSLSEFMPTFAMRNRCRECHGKSVQKWRSGNKPASDAIKGRSFKRSAIWIKSFKDGPCCACNERFPHFVLDFHHVGEKTQAVSTLYEKSKDRIQSEIKKCELICANCHRDETQKESDGDHVLKNRVKAEPVVDTPVLPESPVKWCSQCEKEKHAADFSLLKSGRPHSWCKKCLRQYNSKFSGGRTRSTSEYLKEAKDNRPCTDCNKTYRYWVLDFDHVGEKSGSMAQMRGRSLEELKTEIAKCELVCANCHRKRTFQMRASLPEARRVTEPTETISFDINQIRTSRCQDGRIPRSVLERHHYAGHGREAVETYLAYLQDHVVAVAKFSTVIRAEVATSMGRKPSQVLELDRFCIVPEYQVKNLASKFMASVIRLMRRDRPEVSTLVSFADPAQGHNGGIYRASNWTKVGMTAASYEYVLQDGSRMHKKTLYNMAVKAGLKEREYVEESVVKREELPPKHKFVYELR